MKPKKNLPFLLTRPEWGATKNMCLRYLTLQISTHAPRVGRNQLVDDLKEFAKNFYSRAPSGAQLSPLSAFRFSYYFYSRAPSGAQRKCRLCSCSAVYFYSRAPSGAQRDKPNHEGVRFDFYSRAPSGAQLLCAIFAPSRSTFLLTRPEWGATSPFASLLSRR